MSDIGKGKSDLELTDLTEDYVIDHTDAVLGIVALHAAQVRTVLHQNATMRKLLLNIRPVLRALEATGDKDAAHLVERLNEVLGDLP